MVDCYDLYSLSLELELRHQHKLYLFIFNVRFVTTTILAHTVCDVCPLQCAPQMLPKGRAATGLCQALQLHRARCCFTSITRYRGTCAAVVSLCTTNTAFVHDHICSYNCYICAQDYSYICALNHDYTQLLRLSQE